MKILQIAPLIERVPPKKYGGTERVIHALTEELVRRGHDVTLFATGDSLTSAKLRSVYPRSLREADIGYLYGTNPWTMLNIGSAYRMQGKFDIIHDHNSYTSLPTANLSQTPVVMTLHGEITLENKKAYEYLNKTYFVAISRSQTQLAPNLNYAGIVYNGLYMHHYPFSRKTGKYLLFVGRICIDKGVHYAVEAAERLDMPLIIAAKLDVNRQADVEYFRKYIEPKLSKQIRWIGEVDEKDRNILMSKALCMLHPTTWREPFGLTLIEAMACGCPVVAFNKGSIPEIIMDGKTGFVAENLEEMTESIKKIQTIDRVYCRQYSLQNFSAQMMTDQYEIIYRRILKHSRSADSPRYNIINV